jgi:hypothetical protein
VGAFELFVFSVHSCGPGGVEFVYCLEEFVNECCFVIHCGWVVRVCSLIKRRFVPFYSCKGCCHVVWVRIFVCSSILTIQSNVGFVNRVGGGFGVFGVIPEVV